MAPMHRLDDDDVPWADPAIRAGYESALGQFIVAFNEMDHLVSQIIGLTLRNLGREDLAQSASKGSLAQRLEALDILLTCKPTPADVPLKRLRNLNTHRNNLAHGHFDQNPFDGSYVLQKSATKHEYPLARVAALTAELGEVANTLRHAVAFYEFGVVHAD